MTPQCQYYTRQGHRQIINSLEFLIVRHTSRILRLLLYCYQIIFRNSLETETIDRMKTSLFILIPNQKLIKTESRQEKSKRQQDQCNLISFFFFLILFYYYFFVLQFYFIFKLYIIVLSIGILVKKFFSWRLLEISVHFNICFECQYIC